MQWKNSNSGFGIIAILLHWVMALFIIGLVCIGLYMTALPVSIQKLNYYGWHKEFGMLMFMFIIVRLSWRLYNTTPTLAELPFWEKVAARAVHWAFYVILFLQPIVGWLISSAAGLPVSFFGWFVFPTLIAANEEYRMLFTQVHQALGYILIVIFFLHVSAALKHYFYNKDNIMQRMLWPHSE